MSATRSHPSQALAELAPEVASTVVRIAGDIAVVIGTDGVISNVAEGSLPLGSDGPGWVGLPWADVVCADTRAKAASLLQEASQHGVSRRRELNHPSGDGGSIPMSWAAVRLGEQGPMLAVGRDLRAVAAIQQRFIDVQRDLERGYWERRESDVRYRMLFHVATDAVLVVDAEQLCVLEANPAAAALFDRSPGDLGGTPLAPLFEQGQRGAVDELLLTARASGHAAERRLRVACSGSMVDVSATPFRSDAQRCLLVRARRDEPGASDEQAALSFVARTPDAVVVTDTSGRVLWANPAFAELCLAPDKSHVKGRLIAELLGGTDPSWATLLARVRARGVVGAVPMTLQSPAVAARQADVCAALMTDDDEEHIGFTLRLVSAATPPVASSGRLGAELADLESQLGRVALQQLLDEATRTVELRWVQKALQSSGGRLDGAADVLRISVESLVWRMEQLGLALPAPGGRGGQHAPVN